MTSAGLACEAAMRPNPLVMGPALRDNRTRPLMGMGMGS